MPKIRYRAALLGLGELRALPARLLRRRAARRRPHILTPRTRRVWRETSARGEWRWVEEPGRGAQP